MGQWRKVFFIAAFIYIFCAFFYIIFASGERQAWDDPQLDEPEEAQTLQESFTNNRPPRRNINDTTIQ